MANAFFVHVIGLGLMLVIYFTMKRIAKNRYEVTYHMVERILIFAIGLALLVWAVVLES